MTRFKDNLLLAAMALALSAAFSVAWISGLWLDVQSSLVRGFLVLAAFLVIAIPAWVIVRQGRRQIQAAVRSLESLCLLDYRDLCDDAASLPGVELTNPGYSILVRVRQRFVDLARRLADAQDVAPRWNCAPSTAPRSIAGLRPS